MRSYSDSTLPMRMFSDPENPREVLIHIQTFKLCYGDGLYGPDGAFSKPAQPKKELDHADSQEKLKSQSFRALFGAPTECCNKSEDECAYAQKHLQYRRREVRRKYGRYLEEMIQDSKAAEDHEPEQSNNSRTRSPLSTVQTIYYGNVDVLGNLLEDDQTNADHEDFNVGRNSFQSFYRHKRDFDIRLSTWSVDSVSSNVCPSYHTHEADGNRSEEAKMSNTDSAMATTTPSSSNARNVPWRQHEFPKSLNEEFALNNAKVMSLKVQATVRKALNKIREKHKRLKTRASGGSSSTKHKPMVLQSNRRSLNWQGREIEDD